MTTKINFNTFYVPANWNPVWISDFNSPITTPLGSENSFLQGFRIDMHGVSSIFRTYQHLTQKSVIEQKTQDIERKILQASADLEQFKLIDPARVWEVREAIISDLAQDCGDLSTARQLVNKYMPLENKYLELGHKLHVFDEMPVTQQAPSVTMEENKSSLLHLPAPQQFDAVKVLHGILNKKDWERVSQDPNSHSIPVNPSSSTDAMMMDIIDGMEVCTITTDDIKFTILKNKAAKGDITAKSELLSQQTVKMSDNLPAFPMHITTPKPNSWLLKQSINREFLKAAVAKAKEVGKQGFKVQTTCNQLAINASDVIGGSMGSTAIRYAQGELNGEEAVKEVVIASGKGVILNVVANTAGDVSRSALENFISPDKIPCVGSTMRVLSVGKAILTAPNITEAAKKGTDAAANCAIQYGASILVPTVAPTLGASVGTLAGGAATAALGIVAAPAVAATVGTVVGTVVAIGTVSFVVGGIGTAGIATKDYVVSKMSRSV